MQSPVYHRHLQEQRLPLHFKYYDVRVSSLSPTSLNGQCQFIFVRHKSPNSCLRAKYPIVSYTELFCIIGFIETHDSRHRRWGKADRLWLRRPRKSRAFTRLPIVKRIILNHRSFVSHEDLDELFHIFPALNLQSFQSGQQIREHHNQ